MPRQQDGKVYIGGSDGNATELALSGDVLMSDTGAVTVQASKLAKVEVSYIRTDSGVKTLLAPAAVDRIVHIMVTVTTTFADGNGTQPTVTLDESDSAAKFGAAAAFTSATASTVAKSFAGKLLANTSLQATLVAATGTTSTGAYTIDVIAVG